MLLKRHHEENKGKQQSWRGYFILHEKGSCQEYANDSCNQKLSREQHSTNLPTWDGALSPKGTKGIHSTRKWPG